MWSSCLGSDPNRKAPPLFRHCPKRAGRGNLIRFAGFLLIAMQQSAAGLHQKVRFAAK